MASTLANVLLIGWFALSVITLLVGAVMWSPTIVALSIGSFIGGGAVSYAFYDIITSATPNEYITREGGQFG